MNHFTAHSFALDRAADLLREADRDRLVRTARQAARHGRLVPAAPTDRPRVVAITPVGPAGADTTRGPAW
jgi:hypothetical protein